MQVDAAAAAGPVPPGRVGRHGASFLFALVDQGCASAHSLLLAVLLVKGADPAIYGQFTFVFSAVLFAAGLQQALVGLPLLIHRARDPAGASAEMGVLLETDRWYRLLASLSVTALSLIVVREPLVLGIVCLFGFTYLQRETARNTLVKRDRAHHAAAISAGALLLFLPAYPLLLHVSGQPLVAAFAASAIGTGTSVALVFGGAVLPRRGLSKVMRDYGRGFPGAGWRLLASLAADAQTRSYVFVVTLSRGVDQLGLLEAGRLVWAPLLVSFQAWDKASLPLMSRMLATGQSRRAGMVLLTGLLLLTAAAGIGGILILLAWDVIQSGLFGRYGVSPVTVGGWGAFTLLLVVNWTMASYLNAARDFRALAIVTGGGAVLTVGLLAVLALDVPVAVALGALVAAQVLIGCALAWRAAFGLRRPEKEAPCPA